MCVIMMHHQGTFALVHTFYYMHLLAFQQDQNNRQGLSQADLKRCRLYLRGEFSAPDHAYHTTGVDPNSRAMWIRPAHILSICSPAKTAKIFRTAMTIGAKMFIAAFQTTVVQGPALPGCEPVGQQWVINSRNGSLYVMTWQEWKECLDCTPEILLLAELRQQVQTGVQVTEPVPLRVLSDEQLLESLIPKNSLLASHAL